MNTLEIWHDIVRKQDTARLDEVLAEDCVFLSPVVHTSRRSTRYWSSPVKWTASW